jgi:hypothetical protein
LKLGDFDLPGADFPGGGIHVEDMDRHGLLVLQKSLLEWCGQALAASTKCSMIIGGMEILATGQITHITRNLRHYLALPIVPAHRNAFTSIMFSSHALAVERLRWKERYRATVPREWRLCRFCRVCVEDEVHALLQCRGHDDLAPIRDAC